MDTVKQTCIVDTTPVCLSRYFVNKMCVRSASNNSELRAIRRCTDREFLQRVMKNHNLPEQVITQLSEDLAPFLTNLRTNIRNTCRQDFTEYFLNENKIFSSINLVPVDKEWIVECCTRALFCALRACFFGHNHNRRLFTGQVRCLVHSMHRQHHFLSKTIDKWRLESASWCEGVPQHLRPILVYNLLLWIYKNVLATMIAVHFYVTTTKCTYDETKLFYFPKSEWQSFQDRKLRDMLHAGVIVKYEPYSRVARNIGKHSALERTRLRQIVKAIPKMYLVLKNDDKFRPIVRYKSSDRYDKRIHDRKRLLKLLSKTISAQQRTNIDLEYTSLFKKWVELKRPKLYLVKADLTDAFGSIDRNLLSAVLSQCHKNYQETETNVYLKSKAAAQYKLLIRDLRRPLLLRCGSTAYEWRAGLVQGLKFSPALSDIYYAHLDILNFSEMLRSPRGRVQLFHRVVDDYLFISDSLDDAIDFLNQLSKYTNLNYSKTVTNFKNGSVEVSEQITFLGYVYDARTLEVRRAATAHVGPLCYKTVFSAAVADIPKFIESRIGPSGLHLTAHVFNLHYNTEISIWTHTFEFFCLAANKFCTIVAVLCGSEEASRYLQIFKKEVGVKLCYAVVDSVVKNKPSQVKFNYCINHFRYLAYKALLICATKTKKCTNLVPQVKGLLARSNCAAGVWREHAACIGRDGVHTRAAVREICRRADFKNFIRTCESLPIGFECYDHSYLKHSSAL